MAAGRAWWESAGKGLFDPATERLAEAAVLAAEGMSEEAARVARAGIEAWEKRSMGSMPSAWLRERLEELAFGGERPIAAGGGMTNTQ